MFHVLQVLPRVQKGLFNFDLTYNTLVGERAVKMFNMEHAEHYEVPYTVTTTATICCMS